MVLDQNGIYITKKQASVTAAVLVVLGLLLFIGGYFWGKQSVIDGFTQKTSQESFNDQVDYLLTMQSFAAKNGSVFPAETETENEDEKENKVEELLKSLPDATEERDTVKKNVISPKAAQAKVAQSKSVEKETKEPKVGKHYAALAGFAKKSSADQLVARLKKRNIPVEIKNKMSKSASGKAKKAWYQVVTKSYDSTRDVQRIVDKVLMFEKIKRTDIKIV